MRIGIIGNGVVGRATAKCFPTDLVHDIDPERNRASLDEVLMADLVFVCLPTPQKRGDLDCDTSYLDGFFELAPYDGDYVIRSTVPIGYTKRAAAAYGLNSVCHFHDFHTARFNDECAGNRLILGSAMGDASRLRTLLASRWPQYDVMCMSSDESEAVKLFQNGFSAAKIALFNEMYMVCAKYGLSWQLVRAALFAGNWINRMHTQVPGPDGKMGFGGACLPKDLANLVTHIGEGVFLAALEWAQSDATPTQEIGK
jgi:UDPglucose 6-dehydrogenase